MKYQEKILARKLRSQGLSINEITQSLSIAKSSISLWVRDIRLTNEQSKLLTQKGQSKEVVERRRHTRLAREQERRNRIFEHAKKDIPQLPKHGLIILGTALYWAEGSKTRRGVVEFTNGDPRMIQVMMRFFKEVCEVAPEKFRGYIHIHPNLKVKLAEKYWSNISGIPLNQFYKTYNKINPSSKNLKHTLPYGTFGIYICDTKLFLTIQGWTEKLYSIIIT